MAANPEQRISNARHAPMEVSETQDRESYCLSRQWKTLFLNAEHFLTEMKVRQTCHCQMSPVVSCLFRLLGILGGQPFAQGGWYHYGKAGKAM